MMVVEPKLPHKIMEITMQEMNKQGMPDEQTGGEAEAVEIEIVEVLVQEVLVLGEPLSPCLEKCSSYIANKQVALNSRIRWMR